VLDTDMLTLWLRGQETIGARVAATPPQQLAVTIITMEEVLGGRTQHRRIGTNDLRIAAIVLEQRGILVTRNTNDFADITGLQLDDWA
jgi:predicted nucleic acid-binding protein